MRAGVKPAPSYVEAAGYMASHVLQVLSTSDGASSAGCLGPPMPGTCSWGSTGHSALLPPLSPAVPVAVTGSQGALSWPRTSPWVSLHGCGRPSLRCLMLSQRSLDFPAEAVSLGRSGFLCSLRAASHLLLWKVTSFKEPSLAPPPRAAVGCICLCSYVCPFSQR